MTRRFEPVLKQRIFEARYDKGYRYLDRCGDAMAILEDLLTDQTGFVWLAAEASPASARMICPDLETTVVFSAQSLVVDQTPIPDATCDFSAIADTCLATITGRFDLRAFRRLGARRVKVIAAHTDSVEDAEALSLKVFSIPDWLALANSALTARASEPCFVFETPDRSLGIRITTKPYFSVGTELRVDDRLRLPPHHLPAKQHEALIEQLRRRQARQHKPEAGVTIDIDYYQMHPHAFKVQEFLTAASQASDQLEITLLERHA